MTRIANMTTAELDRSAARLTKVATITSVIFGVMLIVLGLAGFAGGLLQTTGLSMALLLALTAGVTGVGVLVLVLVRKGLL